MSDENKALDNEELEKLIEEKAKELLAQQHSGLIKNREDILSEKKQLESELNELKAKLDKVDFNEYNTLKEKQKKNELVSKGSSQELAELQLQLERLSNDLQSKQKEIEEKDGKYSSIKSKLDNFTKTSELNRAFDEAGISAKRRDILLSYFSSKTDFDSNGNVVIKKDDGTLMNPIDYIKDWSITDSAKPFIDSPYNTGGNANGSGNTLGVKLDTKTTAELHELAKDKPHLLPQIEKEMRSRSLQ